MQANETVQHPGKRLAEELGALGLSANDFAQGIKVPTNRITQILRGQRSVSADTALRLGHFFGTSPLGWMILQSQWDLEQAIQAAGKEVQGLATLKAWRESH